MARKHRTTASTPMTDRERLEHERSQAMERQRRLGRSFTRPERREEIMGETAGENDLQSTHRLAQVDRTKPKKK